MAKQSLLQITLLQTVKLCIPFFFSFLLFTLNAFRCSKCRLIGSTPPLLFSLSILLATATVLYFFLTTFITDPFSLSVWRQDPSAVSLPGSILPPLPPPPSPVTKGLHRNVGFVWIKGTVQKITGCFIVGIAGGLLVLSDGFWKDISTLNRQFSYFHIQAPATFSYLLNLILSHSVCLFVCLPLNYSQEKLKLFI